MTDLPREWCRPPQWLAGDSREAWEPVLRAAQAAWSGLELVSITEGLRESAIVHLEADDLARAGADVSRVGLALSVLEHKEGSFRAVVHHPRLAAAWHAAWAAGDHEAVGVLLGFPACCRAFFSREWVAAGSYRDLTFAMDTVDGPWEANTMLRWLGVRLVPHLPCSSSCAETVAQARAYLEAGRRAGVDVASLETVLRLPVTHDAANEVAIVSTPHFRFLAGADRGAKRAVARRSQEEPGSWTDNGFASHAAMDQAHGAILRVVGWEARSGLDLGCGDGRLLWRAARPASGPWDGVESDPGRAERGSRRYGPLVTVTTGRIQDADLSAATYDVVFLMPGRLVEMDPLEAARIRAALPGLGRRLVLYAYGDWLADGLPALAERAGLGVVGDVATSPGTAAAEGVVR